MILLCSPTAWSRTSHQPMLPTHFGGDCSHLTPVSLFPLLSIPSTAGWADRAVLASRHQVVCPESQSQEHRSTSAFAVEASPRQGCPQLGHDGFRPSGWAGDFPSFPATALDRKWGPCWATASPGMVTPCARLLEWGPQHSYSP